MKEETAKRASELLVLKRNLEEDLADLDSSTLYLSYTLSGIWSPMRLKSNSDISEKLKPIVISMLMERVEEVKKELAELG